MRPYFKTNPIKFLRWRKLCKGKHVHGKYWRKKYNKYSGAMKGWFWND